MPNGVVPYIGTWIETQCFASQRSSKLIVVPYIGTWIETQYHLDADRASVVPYIGTWIETVCRIVK